MNDTEQLPFVLQDLDHIVLRARNADRLIQFYETVLGCKVERALDIGLTQLRAGNALIEIVDAKSSLGLRGGDPPPEANSGRNVDHFCMTIAAFDEDRLRQHLSVHGVSFEFARRVYGAQGYGPSVYLQDPEGNTVELKGPSGPSSQA